VGLSGFEPLRKILHSKALHKLVLG